MTQRSGDDVPQEGTAAAAGPGAAPPQGGGRQQGAGRRDKAQPGGTGGLGASSGRGGKAAPAGGAPAGKPAGEQGGGGPRNGSSGDPFRIDDIDEIGNIDELREILEGELVAAAPEAPVTKEGDLGVDAAAAAGIPELTAVEQLVAERDEYIDALRRLQADFVNYRARVERQQAAEANRKVEALVEKLLPVLDATALAAEHAGEEKDSEAFGQVAALLWDTLEKAGLARVDTAGVPFEPTVHDAVLHVPAKEGEEDLGPVVDSVLRPGFLFRGKCLRPAMVQVRG